MRLSRKVSFFQGLKYHGGGPMLAWMLHRITGVAILVFVGLHSASSFFVQQVGSDMAAAINTIYEGWYFQIFIIFCILFHAMNGLRIVAQDLWPQLQTYHREALWLEFMIFVPVYGLTLFILIQRGLSGG